MKHARKTLSIAISASFSLVGFASSALAAPQACMPSAYRSSDPLRYMLVPDEKGPRLTVSQDSFKTGERWVSADFPAPSLSTFIGGVEFTTPAGEAPTGANLRPDYIHVYLTPAVNPPEIAYKPKAKLVFSLVLDGKSYGPWPMKIEASSSWTAFSGAITTRSADWGAVLPAKSFDALADAFLRAKIRQLVIADGAAPMLKVGISAGASPSPVALAWGQRYWAGFRDSGACPDSRF